MLTTIEELVEKYPKIFQDYEGNPERVNWSCPTGWLNIVGQMCHNIQSHIDNNNKWAEKNPEHNKPIEQLCCVQIKEKFGGLRFYTIGGDEYCNGIISYVQNLSYDICENCGTNQNIGSTQGWIATVCKDCAPAYDRKWNPIAVIQNLKDGLGSKN